LNHCLHLLGGELPGSKREKEKKREEKKRKATRRGTRAGGGEASTTTGSRQCPEWMSSYLEHIPIIPMIFIVATSPLTSGRSHALAKLYTSAFLSN
jgi:hypothetical protein